MSGVNGCYRLIISDQQWADSAALCASYATGAHLAVVSSDLEQQAIASLITAYYAIDSSYSGTARFIITHLSLMLSEIPL
jgi:hypothetical protein